MKTPYEFLQAIRDGKDVPWNKGVQLLARRGVKPARLNRIFEPDSSFDTKTSVQVLDWEAFEALCSQFPAPVEVTNRQSATEAGDSHRKSVTGSMLTLFKPGWPEPRAAVCWDGVEWTGLPEPEQHLLLVENLENFLRPNETLDLALTRCGLNVPADQVMLAFGSGNAAAKACNALFYQHFMSVNCLFDVDLGGIQIWQNIKQLLVIRDMPVRFLVPENIADLLQQSRRKLSQDERQQLKALHEQCPELRSLIAMMYKSHRKLEQETYLD
ncbi:hypothetical protein [Parendozoicomonas haliclonae]|uniref:Wadjet protein JetD C-terminal domain-containing protein n=1 Tax=Parendozoicomonas haliclonae TaxID=1960125 RepID=A0A1X7AMM9_9GAMM|nr:hypothetical protein [Parendozoicomonas haliclonae]SMA49223.1 hypothetical protein EHSB41UT_03124 [Parendozoicomonas haliclonae]